MEEDSLLKKVLIDSGISMAVTREMIEDAHPDPMVLLLQAQHKAHNQETWCTIYTARHWEDLGMEWAAHAALMCDAAEIDFNEPLLAPLGKCAHRHPYDISSSCALKNWEHAQFTPTEEQ